MLKSPRDVVLLVVGAIIAAITFAWIRSGPRIVGQLPGEDINAIRSLLNRKQDDLGSAVRRASSDGIAAWLYNHREGKLIGLEIQGTNRVVAFVETALPPQGRLFVLERSTNGWRITETN